MIPSLLLVFVEQVPNPESDITEGDKAQKSAKQYLSAQKAGSVALKQSVWKVSKKCALCGSSQHIYHFSGRVPHGHGNFWRKPGIWASSNFLKSSCTTKFH